MMRSQLFINSLSLLSNRLIQGISTFALTTVIARSLGAEHLGQYILAIGYYYIFVTLFGLGLKTLFTSELAKKDEEISVYLVSGSLLQFVLSIIAYLLLLLVVFLMPYSSETSMICDIMGLSVIPFALSNITESIFQAQERMHLIAISTSPIYLLRVGVMISIALNFSHPIEYIAVTMVVSEVLILCLQWSILMQTVQPEWKIDLDFMKDSFYAAKILFAIDSVGVVAGKLDLLLISLLGNEILIGIYGAIGQLIQPFQIVCNSLCLAIFPKISNSVLLGKEVQRDNTENYLNILFCILLPVIPIVFFYYGLDVLIFVYKSPDFSRGVIPLQITSMTVIAFPIVRLFNYVLLANGMEKYNLIEVVITTILGSLLGIFLISKYQLIGAAWTGVVMYICSCGIANYAIYNHLFKIRWPRVLIRSTIISGLMVLLLSTIEQFNLNLLSNIVITFSFYMLALISVLMSRSDRTSILHQFLNNRS
jgi:O-antigen/teichoic acid export membrane protein